MDTPEHVNQLFNEIIATEVFDISSTERRIQAVATNERLMLAVQGEMIAQVEVMFAFGGDKTTEECEKNFDDAKACVVDIAIKLQGEYGLSDEDTLKAIELARLDIQKDRRFYD